MYVLAPFGATRRSKSAQGPSDMESPIKATNNDRMNTAWKALREPNLRYAIQF